MHIKPSQAEQHIVLVTLIGSGWFYNNSTGTQARTSVELYLFVLPPPSFLSSLEFNLADVDLELLRTILIPNET